MQLGMDRVDRIAVRPVRRHWFVASLTILAMGGAAFYAFSGISQRAGNWTRLEAASLSTDLAWQEEADRLEALGYLGGSVPATDLSGVILHDNNLAVQGLNLYTSTADNHIRLMDMAGTVLHTWKLDLSELPTIVATLERQKDAKLTNLLLDNATTATMQKPILHPHLLPNGDLLVSYRKFGLVKLDRDSNILWQADAKFHHDLDVTPNGDIYALAMEILPRRISRLPWLHNETPTKMDFIVHLDSEGNELKRIDVLKAFEGSSFRHVLSDMPEAGDITHSNELVYLDGSKAHLNPIYKRGNLLISCREIDAIAVIDPDLEEVVWAMRGPWKKQHSPVLLDNGHILLFDNRGLGDRSRVLEIDPETRTIRWTYGEQPDQKFFSWECGAVQRLPNGNTIVTESTAGRAFEVTPERQVVWEFVNPQRRGNKIATLFRVLRLGSEIPTEWLKKG